MSVRFSSRLLVTASAALALWAFGFLAGAWWRTPGAPGIALEKNAELRAVEGGVERRGQEVAARRAGGGASAFDDLFQTQQRPFTAASLLAAMDELDGDFDSIGGFTKLLSFSHRLSIDDIAPALAIAERTRSGRWIDARKMLVLMRWADLDPQGLTTYLRQQDDNDSTLLRQAATSWAGRDLDAALAWAASVPAGNRDDVARGIVSGLGSHAPAEAMALIQQRMPDALKPDDWAPLLVNQWGRTAPERTAEALLSLPTSPARTEALARLGALMAHRDANAALAWARALPEDGGRGEAMSAVIVDGAADDPAGAAERWAQIPEEQRARAAANITGAWFSRDPAAAHEWADALPDEKSRGEAYEEIGGEYAKQDAARGAAWLDGLAPGKARDQAVEGFAESAARKDPAGAATWALTIGEASQRENLVVSVCEPWKNRDEPAARAWLESTPGVTPAMIEKVFPPKKTK